MFKSTVQSAPPATAANTNFFPRSLTHPPVSGSLFPAVSLPGKGSPCLDAQGRDRSVVRMKEEKRKSPNTAVSGRVSFQPSFPRLLQKPEVRSFCSSLSSSCRKAQEEWGGFFFKSPFPESLFPMRGEGLRGSCWEGAGPAVLLQRWALHSESHRESQCGPAREAGGRMGRA